MAALLSARRLAAPRYPKGVRLGLNRMTEKTRLGTAMHLVRRAEFSGAEALLLKLLAAGLDGKARSRALYVLARGYAGKRSLKLAADLFQQASEGFAILGDCRAVWARRHQAWCGLLVGDTEIMRQGVEMGFALLGARSGRVRTHLFALRSYYLSLSGEQDAAIAAGFAVENCGSAWALCLQAVATGHMMIQQGLITDAAQMVAAAQHRMWRAAHEAQDSEIINLVNQFRSAVQSA